jgi:hypothetical protein
MQTTSRTGTAAGWVVIVVAVLSLAPLIVLLTLRPASRALPA